MISERGFDESEAVSGSVGVMLWFYRQTRRTDLWTIAKALGISPLELRQYELGTRPVPLALLCRASDFFQVSADSFFLPYRKPELFEVE